MNTTFALVQHIIETESFWKAVAFVLVVLLTFVPIYTFLMRRMAQRSAQIQDHIKEALKLRSEAQALLADYEKKDAQRETERLEILEKARKNAHVLKEEAAVRLKERQRMKEQEILDRVKMIKTGGLKELKDEVLAFAVKTTASFMEKDDKFRSEAVFFNDAVDEVEQVLNDSKEVEKIF